MGDSDDEANADPGPDAEEGDPADDDGHASPIRICRPEVADVDALVDLWLALASDQRAYDSHILPEANRDVVRDTLAQHVVTGGIRVAKRGDDVVGFVTCSLEHGSYEQDATRGVVRNVYVRPEYRSRGVGSDLLAAAEAALNAAGATVVALEAMAANDRARAFYRERGYEPHRIQFEKPLDGASAVGSEGGDDSEASPESASIENDTHSKED
jgi:ribosomal protein S18 acetylase RimI-like enzyme